MAAAVVKKDKKTNSMRLSAMSAMAMREVGSLVIASSCSRRSLPLQQEVVYDQLPTAEVVDTICGSKRSGAEPQTSVRGTLCRASLLA